MFLYLIHHPYTHSLPITPYSPPSPLSLTAKKEAGQTPRLSRYISMSMAMRSLMPCASATGTLDLIVIVSMECLPLNLKRPFAQVPKSILVLPS